MFDTSVNAGAHGRHSIRRVNGSVRVIAACLVAALGIAGAIGFRMMASGASDMAYVVAMCFACVVALAIVAPGLFTGKSQEGADFSDEIEKLHSQSKGTPGAVPKKRKWK